MKRLRRWLLRIVVIFLLASLAPVLLFRWVPPPLSAVMASRTLTEGERQDYQWVPMTRMSADIPLAVVASEDQKFPAHIGFDLDAIKDAVTEHAQGGRLRGASTLTQQVARNLFLWQGRSFLLVKAAYPGGLSEYCRNRQAHLRNAGCVPEIFLPAGLCHQP